MPNTYKLTYFNGTGRAEAIRLIFAAGGIAFEDKRIEFADWGALKPTTPFGGLPILEVNGSVVIGQSVAISRFAAREAGLAGKTSVEQALVDSIADTILEFRDKLYTAYYSGDAAQKEAALAAFASSAAPPLLEKINKFLAANNGGKGFLVGSTLTWADLLLFATIEASQKLAPKSSEEVDKFPLLKDLLARVAALPKVAAYLKSRPSS